MRCKQAGTDRLILPVVLEELVKTGVGRDQIVLINALGTHRPSPPEELVEFLGEEIVRNYRIVQHDCKDRSTMLCAGRLSNGQELWANRDYLQASRRMLTGFIEPHFFAGFSGGGKLVLPGIAGLDNVMSAHSYEILDCRRSTWGITTGSPVYELVTEAALVTAPDFIVNVALNRNKETTGVFSGDLRAAHAAGVEYVKSVAMQRVPEPFDIVITTNSGYPLDRNLYQTVKGMCAAASVVKPGGAIIVAAQCVDGVPSGSSYQRLLEKSGTPEGAVKLISSPGFSALDQWQLQIQARVQLKAKVFLYSEGLSDEEIKNAMLTPCHDIEETLAALMVEHGPGAPICVLPEGP